MTMVNQKNVFEVREKLDKIMEEVKKDNHFWRFSYSVGLADGSCFGCNYEDSKKLKKINVKKMIESSQKSVDYAYKKGIENGRGVKK